MAGAEVALALEIARCPEVERARRLVSHPCSSIVRLQQEDPGTFQVPEGWAGNLSAARVVFLSSNPSISEDGADHRAGSAERYPRAAWADHYIADFMTRRFAPDAGHTDGDRFICQDGTFAPQAVRFWTLVRRRAEELLGYPRIPIGTAS